MRAAVNINTGPVKFEFDLRDLIEIQTKDGGEAKIKIKGDITFTKNGKEIQLNYENTSLSLTHLINGEEEEIKQKLDKSNSLVQTMAIEFEKTKVKISYDKLWSTLSSDGTTFSQGTHQEGDKVYLRFKYESPELETALPPDPLGNTWSSKMHGWAVTIDYRPGKLDNKNDLDDLSGLAPEYVLTDYYYHVLAAKKAATLAGIDKKHSYMKEYNNSSNLADQKNEHKLSNTTDAASPLTEFSGSFYPYNALAHHNISPERASREALLAIGAALVVAPFILEFWPVFIRMAPTIIRTLPKIIPKAPLPPAGVAPMIKGIPGS